MQTLQFVRESCKVLVVGAGGLGCELLKNLVSMTVQAVCFIDIQYSAYFVLTTLA